MAHRSPARWLAPLALVVCVATAFSVVQSGRSSSGGGTSPAATDSASPTATRTTKASTHATAAKRSHVYVVKSGDVLSTIAAAHGTTVQALQTANPSVDAAALHVGQKLRLPR